MTTENVSRCCQRRPCRFAPGWEPLSWASFGVSRAAFAGHHKSSKRNWLLWMFFAWFMLQGHMKNSKWWCLPHSVTNHPSHSPCENRRPLLFEEASANQGMHSYQLALHQIKKSHFSFTIRQVSALGYQMWVCMWFLAPASLLVSELASSASEMQRFLRGYGQSPLQYRSH